LATREAQVPHRRAVAARAWRARAAFGGAVLAVGMFVVATLSLTHGGESVAGVTAALLRFVRYLGALLAVGGFVFVAAVRPGGWPVEPRARRLTLVAAGAAVAASLLALPVQAAYLSGRAAASVDGAALTAVVTSGFGHSVGVGTVGLALLAFGVARVPAPSALSAGAAGCLLALGAFLLTGHSVVSEPQSVALPANLAHTAAAAVWLGGLVLLPLTLAERREAEDPLGGARLVGRFSTVATIALGVVAAAGTSLAWVEVRSVAALDTAYGTVLLVKVTLVGIVVALAAYNNRRLVPAIRNGAGWDRLLRTVRLEAVGLVGVVAVTAVLVNIVPARVDAGVDAQVVRMAPLGADQTVTLVVEPARPGVNEVHVYITGARLDAAHDDLAIEFVPPGAQHAAATVTPPRVGPGHWLHLGGELSENGVWEIRLISRADGDAQRVTMTVPVTGVEDWDDL
jgi:copper transport protein